jgi:hypothetical protein
MSTHFRIHRQEDEKKVIITSSSVWRHSNRQLTIFFSLNVIAVVCGAKRYGLCRTSLSVCPTLTSFSDREGIFCVNIRREFAFTSSQRKCTREYYQICLSLHSSSRCPNTTIPRATEASNKYLKSRNYNCDKSPRDFWMKHHSPGEFIS